MLSLLLAEKCSGLMFGKMGQRTELRMLIWTLLILKEFHMNKRKRLKMLQTGLSNLEEESQRHLLRSQLLRSNMDSVSIKEELFLETH
jgi:hypothetical protein